ncbi:hypothetical protein ACN08L_16090 (plasmid) [Photobacterium leiognathi subsp. mandapamensis]|uniref:hypothetical protein n=2 Tax=Photobacterium leiognathi TaxID=553611 RepID=UPI003AF3AE1A
MKIPFTLSNVAEVAVSPINADATLAAGGAGNRMMFAGVVVSPKGKPFEVLQVTASNWQRLLGKPFHSSKGIYAESLRQVADAVNGGNGCVVRVVPNDFKFPVLTLNLTASGGGRRAKAEVELNAPGEVVATVADSAMAFGTEIPVTDDTALAVWIADGSESTNRKVSLVAADVAQYGEGMFELKLVEVDSANNETEVESFIVSMDEDALDDMGSPAFIETVLESRSQCLMAKVGPKAKQMTNFPSTAFVGGTSGDLSALTADDYNRAISVLSASVINFTAVCSLGIYDEQAIRGLVGICENRRIGGFVDINPRLNYADAIQAATDLALNKERVSLYHLPYDYKDGFYGNRVVCGISGIAFTAKARGVAKTFPTGGWHYTPAGEERAVISRTGLRALTGIGEPDYEAMYKTRINKVSSNAAGLLFIDDSLTTCVRENYLRFEQVVSVADAISRDFYNLANGLKHNPDGITFEGLVNGMTDILDGYVSVGALVQPRNPEDGKEPYQLFIEQTSIDSWKCRWAICVSGSGRRFLGEPVLVR